MYLSRITGLLLILMSLGCTQERIPNHSGRASVKQTGCSTAEAHKIDFESIKDFPSVSKENLGLRLTTTANLSRCFPNHRINLEISREATSGLFRICNQPGTLCYPKAASATTVEADGKNWY